MSKLVDRLIAEALFNKEPKVRKKDMTSKLTKEIERQLLEELKKKLEKKDEKKGSDTAWAKLSTVQKLTILMITVPLGLMLEMFVILKFAIVIGTMIKQ